MSGQQAKGRCEIVEDEFWDVVCRTAVAGNAARGVPVCDCEVEGRSGGKVDDGQA